MTAGAGGSPEPQGLEESIRRLDRLLAEAQDPEGIKVGMGIRLALGLARELREKRLGGDTSALVAGWTERYGPEAVEAAVAMAKGFLTRPGDLRQALAERLGLRNPEAAGDNGAGGAAGEGA